MINISHEVTALLGDAVSPYELSQISKDLRERLEMNVGTRIADRLDNRQLDEFVTLFEQKDDAGAFEWLSREVPEYKDIVAEEWDSLLGWFARAAGVAERIGA
jgi:hypothetical protein